MADTVDRIRQIIGEENAMSGDAVSTAIATTGTVNEIMLIVLNFTIHAAKIRNSLYIWKLLCLFVLLVYYYSFS